MATLDTGGSENGRPVTKRIMPVKPSNQTAANTVGNTGTGGVVPSSAAQLLQQTLIDWGLQSLLPHLQDYLKAGYDSTTINLALQDTAEWKARFAGNEIRKANGLGVLTPAQYIATEEQYRNVLQSYGLPSGFYDSHDDFNAFIGNDISPQELQSRAQVAHDTYFAAPQEWRDMWAQYGFSHGDAIASILDPNVGTQILQDRAAQVQIGGTAKQYGFNVDQQRAQQFQQHGTTLDQARKAYQQLGQYYQTDQNIANRFGQTFGQTQEENDLLLGDASAANQRKILYNEEQGLFDGRAGGADQHSLAISQSY